MRIFLDTANIDQIRHAAKLGVISGVTTNPSLMSKEGPSDYQTAIKEICDNIPGAGFSRGSRRRSRAND